MNRVLPQELLQYVRHGREERYLEYKERLDWSQSAHQVKLVKAVLGMSNVRGGGVLVIGVKKDGTAVGLSEEEALQFTQDAVAAVVNTYAAPYAEITVTTGTDSDASSWFVIVQVSEFDQVPVICKRDGNGLRQGAVYTRGRRIHETTEVRSEAEMREIIEMAISKGVDKELGTFFRRFEGTGIPPSPMVDHRARFEAELEDL